MSKLNPNVKSGVSPLKVEVRLAGGAGTRAAKQEDLALLRRVVLANLLWENIAYADGVSVTDQISALIPKCNPIDVANLAVEARLEQKLRHTPLFICAEMLKHPEHALLVADILPKIITRADMITDFLAIYKKGNKGKLKPLASAAKKGLAKSFANFNEYHFAKYDRNSEIKLRDAMFLVHPKPEQDKAELYKKVADRTLKTPDTWEVALSTGKDKKETWTRLIDEKKIGGLAMLRNVRNMVQAGVNSNTIRKGLATLNSTMLLPLNYLTAARYAPDYSRDIESAMLEAYKNLPKLPGKTLFIVDVSGSMGSLSSGESKMNRLDHACAMAMLAINQCENYEVVATAGNDSTRVGAHLHLKNPKKGFDVFKQIFDSRTKIGGGGIFTRQCLEWCKSNVSDDFDRIIIFSDSQDCDAPNARIPKPFGKYNYICDVSSEKRGINFKNVWTAEISGFSENFLTYIAAYEGLTNKFEDSNAE